MVGGASRSLSQRERAGGEGPHSVRIYALTLTLSQRERGQESKAKKVIGNGIRDVCMLTDYKFLGLDLHWTDLSSPQQS
jgi:hypothetical protein